MNAEELSAQALAALQHGYDGSALQQLAGLHKPSLGDLGILPQRAFTELGLDPMTQDQASEFLASHYTSGVMLALLKAFPAFSGRWKEHVASCGGEQAGAYNDMAEFVHFVIDELYDEGNWHEVRRVFQLMEQFLIGADEDRRNLIGLGFFETLQNVASWKPGGYQQFEQFLGPISLAIWRELQRIWAGKSRLADVIRAEQKRG